MDYAVDLKTIHDCVDKSWYSNPPESAHLSIQISIYAVSIAILDSAKNKYLVLKTVRFTKVPTEIELPKAVAHYLSNEELVTDEHFKTVSATVINAYSTLIPQSLFEPEKAKEYLSFNQPILASEPVFHEKLRNIDAQSVFTVSKELKEVLENKFPQITIKHNSSVLIDALLNQYKNTSEKFVVNMEPTHFEVVLIRNNKLIYYNSFAHQTSEDFLYYLLFAAEQLQLNPEEVDLIFLGEVDKKSAIYDICYSYVRHVSFGSRPETYEYSFVMNELPKHYYYNLFSQHICVS